MGKINDPNIPPIPPDVDLHTNLRAIGMRTVRDTRPNHFFPTSGSKVQFTADFYAQAMGIALGASLRNRSKAYLTFEDGRLS